MRRGRPPHDDILTPREWDVLQLLRDGLTNEQIAARLGISLSGAKYHVSEILSKLGVSSREQAARWFERGSSGRRSFGAIGLAWLAGKSTALKVTGAIAGAGAAGGFVLLLALALASREPDLAAQAPGPLGRVAYVRDGNIWVRDVDGGPERQVTDGGSDLAPRWSPSGEWLDFQRATPEPGAHVVRRDGSGARHLDAQGLVAWSPVEDVLAYFLADGSLVTERPDGTDRRLVSRGIANPSVQERRLNPVWSEDGQWIAFEQFYSAQSVPPVQPFIYVGIRTVRLDGSDEQEVFSPPGSNGEVTLAYWASHGAEALIWVNPVLSASIRAGGLPLNLVTQAMRPADERSGLTTLVYEDYVDVSPDGRWAAIVAGGGRESWTHKSIVRLDLSSGAMQTLTPDGVAAVSPAWSPAGSRVAYVSGPDLQGVVGGDPARVGLSQRRIRTMDSSGNDSQPVTTSGEIREEHPAWSSDGTTILFAGIGHEGDTASLWTVPSHGGDPVQVVDGLRLPGSPARAELWFGYYGHVDWDLLYDWWQPRTTGEP